MQLFYVCVIGDNRGRLQVDVTQNILDSTDRQLQEPVSKYAGQAREKSGDWKYKLIYFECFRLSSRALARKRDIHSWKNDKLLELVNFVNPEWYDLSLNRQALKSAVQNRQNNN